MYFPSDMTAQYFFFDTYLGYFLQALPIALLAGLLWGIGQVRRGRPAAVLPALFVCYLTGLLCLTLFQSVMGEFYYILFYHRTSGRNWRWFTFVYDLVPDFHLRFGAENLGNILMFLPFGVLCPLSGRGRTWGRTVAMGLGLSVGIELLQPIFGRSFDINDIILNGLGVLASATVFFCLKKGFGKKA